MKAEIISIGTELLLGQIQNTNATYLSEELASIGVSCYYQTTVGDNKQRIKDVLEHACERADILLITGGLGPTPDDLTHETLAEFFGVEMQYHQSIKDSIQEFFAKRNREYSQANKKQAYLPETAEILNNPTGTAPGIVWKTEKNNKDIYVFTFPGVPSEMHSMWKETVRQYLLNLTEVSVLSSRELKIFNMGESKLMDYVSDLLESSNPTVAPYAQREECKLRITARASTEQEAQELISPVIDEIYSRVGEYIYGENSDNLSSVVDRLLKTHKLTISVAESCTGGLVSKRLTDNSGSSQYTGLNLITYSNKSKSQLLKVKQETLDNYGAVSEQTALEMSRGLQELTQSDINVSITGIAGPESDSTDKPVGLVYICILYSNQEYNYQLNIGNRGRDNNRWLISQHVLNYIRQLLN